MFLVSIMVSSVKQMRRRQQQALEKERQQQREQEIGPHVHGDGSVVKIWPSGFESKKQADFSQMSRLWEFVSLLMGGRKG
ncbi:MAG TPA: hypothetical protein PKD78_12525, partial [Saprospiraceae bacterium]|nr:hypothetical protein [Saprospiraceae bacterium]